MKEFFYKLRSALFTLAMGIYCVCDVVCVIIYYFFEGKNRGRENGKNN